MSKCLLLLVQAGCSDWLVVGGVLLNQPLTVSINGMLERFSRKLLKKAGKLWIVISLLLQNKNYPDD